MANMTIEIPEDLARSLEAITASQQHRELTLDENDLWIAATALALDATRVSRDGDFRAIQALALVEHEP